MEKYYGRYYKKELLRHAISKRGIVGFVSLALKLIQYRLGRRCYKVFVLTPSDFVNSSLGEVPGYKIEMLPSYGMIDSSLKGKLIQYQHLGYISWDLEEMQKKGACLWTGYLNGELSTFVWTTTGDKVQPYFFPTINESAHISNWTTLPKYRRQGLYVAGLAQIIRVLIDKNFKLIYAECGDWNVISERALRRLGFHFIGVGKIKKDGSFIW